MNKLTLLLKKIVYSIFTLGILVQCERDIFPHEYRDIYGNWTLRGISGGFTGGWMEPKFDILTIQHGMKFSIYRNDTLLSKGTIEIINETSDYIEADFISKENYLGLIGSKSIRLRNDTLILSDNCSDCYSSLFVRNEIYSNPTYSQASKTLDFLEVTNYPIGYNKYCNSVYFQSETLGFLTCSDGSILKSDDGGKNWRQTVTNNKLPLYGISFISDLVGFAVGGESGCSGTGCKVPGYLMLKTVNGGESWDSVPLPYKMADLKIIKFYSSNFGIAIGTGAKLLTRDGGQTWINFSSEEMKVTNNLYLLNENIAYISGLKGQLFKTSNGGNSWQNLPYNYSTYIRSIMFLNEQIGYISFYDLLLKTSDGGLNWSEIENGPTGASLINFTSESNGVVFGSRTYASSKWDIWDSYFNIMINGKWYGDIRVTSHSVPYCLNSKTFYTITGDNKISIIKLKN